MLLIDPKDELSTIMLFLFGLFCILYFKTENYVNFVLYFTGSLYSIFDELWWVPVFSLLGLIPGNFWILWS
jgi:hypothetical protein